MAHSDETKAAVLAALLAGQGVNAIAKEYDLAKSVVSRWKNELAPEQVEQIGTQKRANLTSLVENHLATSLEAATTIADTVSKDTAWLKGQTASDVAVLYGVLTDKAIRILEAIEPPDEESADGVEEV
jgi:transposase